MKRLLFSYALACACGILPGTLASAAAEAPAGSGTLVGHAFRTKGAAGGDRLFVVPIVATPAGCVAAAGAEVTAVGTGGVAVSGTAGTGGAFSLSVPAGSYVFRAQLAGLASAATALTVGPGQTISVTAGEAPSNVLWVTDARAADSTHVDVYLSGSVASVSSAAFTIRPPLAVLGASADGSGRVRLTTAPQSGGTTYSAVATNLRAADGRVLDPTHASALFTGIGDGPQVVDAVAVDPMHVDICFSAPILAGSATNTSNYSFSPGLQVISAAVLDGGKRVRLITSEQSAGVVYTAFASGVRDATGATLSFGSSAPFVGLGQGPRVLAAQSIDDTHVQVRFDEEIAPFSLQAGNFTIPGLPVLDAVVAGDARVVRLSTPEQHAGFPYRVLASGLRDEVDNPMGGSDNAADFVGRGTAPSLASAYAVDSTHVELAFSEPLDPASVSSFAAQFAPALTKGDVSVVSGGCALRVAVSEMLDGGSYTVSASGVRDLAGNAVPAGSPAPFRGAGVAPRLLSAWVVDTTHVDVRYSEPVQAVGTYGTTPYVNVAGAAVQPDGVTVRLTTAEMTAGTSYTLNASGVTDKAGNALDPSAATATFGGAGRAPAVVSATAVESVTVDVLFSEAVTPTSAQAIANYAFSPALSISFAQLQGDGRTVRLTTSEQKGGAAYQVAVSNVQDAAGNVVAGANNRAAFTGVGVPPTLGTAVAVDSTHVDLSFSEALDPGTTGAASRYAVSPSLAVTGAQLLGDGLTVRLTTAEQRNAQSYTVTVTGVQDVPGNAISGSNTASFSGIGVSPTVGTASVFDSTTVDVVFDEALLAADANVPSRYLVTPGLVVTSATLQGDGVTVRLTTTEQKSGESYTVTVSGVKDLAGNPISAAGNSASFTGIGVAPTVASASAVNSTTVDVVFDEPLLAGEANIASRYALSPALAVTAAALQGDGKSVRLTTAEQRGGASYTVTVSGVKDLAGNVLGSPDSAAFTGMGTAPRVTSAAAVDSHTVDVVFNEAVGSTTAVVLGGYSIAPALAVSAAALQGDGVTVRLTTPEQKGGESYTVTVTGVKDLAGNVIEGSNTAVFTGTGVSPTVASAAAVDSTHVDVTFDEELLGTIAAVTSHYTFSPALAVTGAALQPGGLTVRLTTSEQKDGQSYTVTASSLADLVGNLIGGTGNTATFTGQGIAPQVVSASAVNANTVDVLFDEAVGATSAATAANYAIAPALSVTAAAVQGDGVTVRLTTDWQDNVSYTVTVAAVTDVAGNAVDPGFHSAPFDGISATTLSGLEVTQVAGAAGSNLGVYRYRATVTNAANAAPTSVRLTIKKPDAAEMGAFDMAKVNAGDTNYAGGVLYEWRSSVLVGDMGAYSFQVDATDGSHTAAPATLTGPTVTALDASRLAFQSNQDGNDEIYAMESVGSAPTNLTSNGAADSYPSWSPDGSRAAFVTTRDGDDEIYAINADGSGLVRLTNSTASDSYPAWSPDGSKIAFVSNRGGNPNIYVMGADGSDPVCLTDDPVYAGYPAWSPDGSRIAFHSNRDGNHEIYVMGADGSAQTRLTTSTADDGDPVWSPDGSKIAFSSNRDGNFEVYVMDSDGGNTTRLTATAGFDGYPAWSPDGARLAYAHEMDGEHDIFVMNSDGSGQTDVFRNAANQQYPAWGRAPEPPSPHSVALSAQRPVLMADGTSTMTVTATVRDGGFRPLAGVTVSFGATGAGVTASATTDTGGLAVATLTAGATTGVATVTANVTGGKDPSGATTVEMLPVGRIAYHAGALYTCDSDGTDPTLVSSTTTASHVSPALSPDGRSVAYEDQSGSVLRIAVTNAGGGGTPVFLTGETDSCFGPAWSPDAGRIAYMSNPDGNQDIFVMDADGTNARRLTTESGVDNSPAWSPDGQQIAFYSDRSGNGDIWVMNADGSNPVQVTHDTNDDLEPSWSPDGSKIVFRSNRTTYSHLCVINPDGSNETRLTNVDAADSEPCWSPDGTRILFQSDRISNNRSLWIMRPDGGDPRPILSGPYTVSLTPTWGLAPQAVATFGVKVTPVRPAAMVETTMPVTAYAYDGSYQPRAGASVSFTATSGTVPSSAMTDAGGIATTTFTAGSSPAPGSVTATLDGKGGTAQLEVVPKGQLALERSRLSDGATFAYAGASDGTGALDVTGNSGAGGVSGAPTWSPDGRCVAFPTDYTAGIARADASARTTLPLPTGLCCADQFAWSPDGSLLAFSAWSDSGVDGQIWVMDPEGNKIRTVASVEESVDPAWSPDGSKIAFARGADGVFTLWVVDAAGVDGNLTQLTTSGTDRHPSWSPDGSQIAFRSERDGVSEIYVMDADGSGQTRLTTAGSAGADRPCWSPDGAMIAYSLGSREIRAVMADGSRDFQLVATPAGYEDQAPAWAPVAEAPSPYSVALDGTPPVTMAGGAGTGPLSVSVRDGSFQPVGEGASVTFTISGTPTTVQTSTDSMAQVEVTPPATSGYLPVAVSVRDARSRERVTTIECPVLPAGRLAFSYAGTNGDGVWAANSDFSDASLVADTLNNDRRPAWSPDGRRLAFTASGDGSYGALTRVPFTLPAAAPVDTDYNGGYAPAWSPDATRLVGTDTMDGHLYVYPVGGGSPTLLTNGAGEVNPSWSADGSKIAYEALTVGEGFSYSSIVVMGADGSNPTVLVPGASGPLYVGGCSVGSPASPAGAATAATRGQSTPVKGASASGQAVRTYLQRTSRPTFALTATRGAGHSAFGAGSGTRVAGSSATPRPRLMRRHSGRRRSDSPAVGAVTPLQGMSVPIKGMAGAVYCSDPAWSPDGTRIAYAAGPETSKDLYLVDVANPTNTVQLTTNSQCDERSPAWSPDGQWLAFTANNGGEDFICVLNVSRPAAWYPLGPGRDPRWASTPATPTAYGVALASDKSFLQAGGSGTASVTATVFDGGGWPLSGAAVDFTATGGGSYVTSPVTTATDGMATTAYTSGTTTGPVALTASTAGTALGQPATITGTTTVDLVDGRIAFAGADGTLTVMDAGGGTPAPLGTGSLPSWTPDGQRIYFSNPTSTATDLYAMDRDGNNLAPVGEWPSSTVQTWVRVSPDGSRIVFQSDEANAGQPDIYVADADGANAKRLTTTGADHDPSWSPDGKRILWARGYPTGDEICSMGADGKGVTRLTFNNVPDLSPAYSPDGQRIAFVVNKGSAQAPDLKIHVMNADGSGRTQLLSATASSDSCPCWSPDGNYLVFARTSGSVVNIYVCRADGSRVAQVTNDGLSTGQPAWGPSFTAASPYSVTLSSDRGLMMAGGTCTLTATVRDGAYQPMEGQTVAFTPTDGTVGTPNATDAAGQTTVTYTAPATARSARVTASVSAGRNPAAELSLGTVGEGRVAYAYGLNNAIHAVDPSGANDALVTTNNTGSMSPLLSWSPDGEYLAFQSGRDGDHEIYRCRVDGSGVENLTNSPGSQEYDAVWSPDGSRIAYRSNCDGAGTYEIYTMGADGSDPVRLTNDTYDDAEPAWSPDGRRIAFASDRGGLATYGIWVMGPDGSKVTSLTNQSTADDRGPAWSPDGSRIAWWRNFGGGDAAIWVMNADGTGQTQITSVPGYNAYPSWSTDGSKIVFHSTRDGHEEVYVMDADGANQTRLTAIDGTEHLCAAWSSGLPVGNYSARIDGAKQVYSEDYGGVYDLGTIPSNGTSTKSITFTVRGGHFEPRAGESVAFTTDRGSLDQTTATTDATGQATVVLTSGTAAGVATVTLRAGGARGEILARARVHFCGAGRIAFGGSNSFSVNGLFTVLPDGSDLRHIPTASTIITDPAWSPDGTRVAYSDNGSLYAVGFDGTGMVQLTSTGADYSPSWSPDGSTLVYGHWNGTCTEIYTVPSTGGTAALLASASPTDLSNPDWSPDGTRILVARRVTETTDICVMGSDGSNLTVLHGGGYDCSMASWSRDGSKITFISKEDHADGEVYVMDADGANVARLTNNTSVDFNPSFSADGEQIVYSNSSSGLHHLYMVRSDGSESDGSQFTIDGHYDVQAYPCWSRGTDPLTGRTPKAPRSRTQNARLRAYCNGQEAFALLTPLGVVPEGRADGLITTGEETRDPRPETQDRASASGRAGRSSILTPEPSSLRFVALTSDETAGSGLGSRVSGLSGGRSWSFALEAPDANAEITLSWPDLSGLGSKERVMLEDLDGAKRRSMRTTAGYTFRAGDAARRRFRVTTDARKGPAILMTGLQLLGADGGARSPGNSLRTVRFTISTEASVNIRLVAPTGREVAVLAQQYAATTGQNQLSWRGALSAGLYLMEATATTDDGTAVKMVQPVVVVR